MTLNIEGLLCTHIAKIPDPIYLYNIFLSSDSWLVLTNHNSPLELSAYTVTRPYAGFRHPDRMAPDKTVRGGENDCPILSGNILLKVPKFSVINRSFP